MSPARPSPAERGQSSVLAVGVIVLILAVGMALVGLAAELTARGRAQAVADLTVLAATWGDDAAHRVASRNHATVVSVEHRGDRSVVVVDLAGRRATAAAER